MGMPAFVPCKQRFGGGKLVRQRIPAQPTSLVCARLPQIPREMHESPPMSFAALTSIGEAEPPRGEIRPEGSVREFGGRTIDRDCNVPGLNREKIAA